MKEPQQATILDDGAIQCACGRHLGKITETGVRMPRCPGCERPVDVPINVYKLRLYEQLMKLIAAV